MSFDYDQDMLDEQEMWWSDDSDLVTKLLDSDIDWIRQAAEIKPKYKY